MTDPYRFLTSLGQALSTLALYPMGHPSRERAIDTSYDLLRGLDLSAQPAEFTFLGGDVIYRHQIVPGLVGWEWGARLAAVGIERVEFRGDVTREEYAGWLDEVQQRLAGESMSTAEARHFARPSIRYGMIEVQRTGGATDAALPLPHLPLDLRTEVDAVRWMHQEVEHLSRLAILEAMGVVRSLSATMHTERRLLLPLLELKEYDQYTTTHSCNVAVLAMGLCEHLGLSPREVRAYGMAGLLHDLGKIRIPHELLVKPGPFTDAERQVIQQHPVEGAKLILTREARLEVAAFVAYEHHVMLDGGGYPALRYARSCHAASRIVHICDVYDALRTERPYRGAWDADRALAYLDERKGSEFDPELVDAFTQMMRASDQVRIPLPS
ncbi:MAG TPA: HD domain-containing phosphohydrolase [Gemmatimonadales bacterium]|nr:HD domain-containing phosphohydrolase [Gemmatimonadales bacterium]